MPILTDKVFKNREVLDEETLSKYKLNALEDIGRDLVDYASWDMKSPVGTVALKVGGNMELDQAILHLLGETDQKRIDSKTVFGEKYEGGSDQQIRVGKIELQKFRFRGSAVSDWLGPQDFHYSVQRPSTTQPGAWREVEKSKVEADGGQGLWIRAVVQPWTGLKIKLTVGIFAAKDISKVAEASHHRYPFINLLSLIIPMMPFPPEDSNICLPFVPYILDDREEDDGGAPVPRWTVVVKAVNGLFRRTTTPHSKSNMDTLTEALKGDWRQDRQSKYLYPELETGEDDENDDVMRTEEDVVHIEGTLKMFGGNDEPLLGYVK